MSINLLPWRELKRKAEHKQRICWLLLTIAIVFTAIFIVRWQLGVLIKKQTIHSQKLQKKLKLLDNEITKITKLKQRQQALTLQRQSLKELLIPGVAISLALDDLVKVLPQAVTITLLRYHGRYLRVQGLALSEEGVFLLLKKLHGYAWLKQVVLKDINKMLTEGFTEVSRFQLLITLVARPNND